MSIKKVTLASLILFSLTACSGGSGGNTSNTTKPQPAQQTTQQKAQAEQKEKEKAEAERLAAEKVAKEKAEAERLIAEKATKEKAEAERLIAEKATKEKAEAERLAAEKLAVEKDTLRHNTLKEITGLALHMGFSEAEANEYAQSVVDKVINENFDYKYSTNSSPLGLVYELYSKADKLLAESGITPDEAAYNQLIGNLSLDTDMNFNQFKQNVANHLATKKAEMERLENRIETIKSSAIEGGLSEQLVLDIQSHSANPPLNDELLDQYEQLLKNAAILLKAAEKLDINTEFHHEKLVEASLNGNQYSAENAEKIWLDTFKGITSDKFNEGLNRGNPEQSAKTTFEIGRIFERVETKREDVYNQKYSAVVAQYYHMNGRINGIPVGDDRYDIMVNGLNTKPSRIPHEGKATYQGAAFGSHEQGTLNYRVDFAERSGEGDISNLREGQVTLQRTQFDDLNTLSGYAETEYGTTGSYSLEFFGPQAEEVSGKMYLGEIPQVYGLAGTRGEIQK